MVFWSTKSDVHTGVELTDSDFRKIRDLLYEMTGIALNENKRELVVARLSKRLRQLGMSSVGQYLKYVREDSTQAELITMLNALATNLTSFWREPQHFDYLEQVFVPRWLERSGRSRRPLRGWSAGCSTGEEAYGIAMLVLENLPPAERRDFKLLATDLSTRALEVARAGVYPEERVRPVPAKLRNRFLIPQRSSAGMAYRVCDEVRQHITFARLNLMEEWPMRGPLDFIFCRNVMIYFDKPTQARLVRRFHDLLAPGGTLFIGHSESLTGVTHHFRYVRPTIYEKA